MKLYDGGRAPNPRRVRIYLAEKGIAYRPVCDPVPVERFLEYGQWFRRHAVGDVRRKVHGNQIRVARRAAGLRQRIVRTRIARERVHAWTHDRTGNVHEHARRNRSSGARGFAVTWRGLLVDSAKIHSLLDNFTGELSCWSSSERLGQQEG